MSRPFAFLVTFWSHSLCYIFYIYFISFLLCFAFSFCVFSLILYTSNCLFALVYCLNIFLSFNHPFDFLYISVLDSFLIFFPYFLPFLSSYYFNYMLSISFCLFPSIISFLLCICSILTSILFFCFNVYIYYFSLWCLSFRSIFSHFNVILYITLLYLLFVLSTLPIPMEMFFPTNFFFSFLHFHYFCVNSLLCFSLLVVCVPLFIFQFILMSPYYIFLHTLLYYFSYFISPVLCFSHFFFNPQIV